jgi:methionyl-tRNA formyltransferase
LGTPAFAVPTLKALIESDDHQVGLVICQPDRPAGRGNKIHEPPVKQLALKNNIAVLQPVKLSKSPETLEKMRQIQADVIVMVAFGQILKKEVLNLTPYGVINIHASLLPQYRGPAPINWAIINGESVSGVTPMLTEAGVDTGPMLLKHEVPIGASINSEELSSNLAEIGAKLLLETLALLSKSSLKPEAQDESRASLAPMMNKKTGEINWHQSSLRIHNLVRGLVPWPGAYTLFEGSPLKVLKTQVSNKQSSVSKAGILHLDSDGVFVSCDDGHELLELLEVQPANKQKMPARSWINGVRLKGGEELGA